MNIVYKKTTELSDVEIEQYCSLFERVFVGSWCNPKLFKEKFLNTAKGYSYHSLMIANDQLVGAINYVPFHYVLNGKVQVIVLSVDMMVKDGYRDLRDMSNMAKLAEMAVMNDGINFIFGFPNDNAHTTFVKLFKFKDIGKLQIYILPYRIGGIKPKFEALDSLSIMVAQLFVFFSNSCRQKKVVSFAIDKDRQLQEKYRLKWFDADYKVCHLKNFTFIYRIFIKDNVRTAFLVDIDKVSPFNIAAAIKHIIKADGKNFDLIMYVGHLPFNPFPLIRVPRKLEPKNFFFIGKILDSEKVDADVLNLNNWNINLLCYDLV